MNRLLSKPARGFLLSIALAFCIATVRSQAAQSMAAGKSATAQATSSAAPAKTASTKSTKNASSVSDADIAAAKAAGKVWVNLDSKVYHKGGRWYGKTKNGKFMTEAEAKAAGYKPSTRGN